MGWDSASNWNTKEQVVNETLASYARSGYQVHDHASTTQGLYIAVTTPQNVSLIICIMIKRSGGEIMRKSMSEDMGPAMDDCPLRLLELKSDYVSHQYASIWRAGVRAFHAKKAAAKLVPKVDLLGKTIELYGKTYQVFEKAGKSYRARLTSTGQLFKIGPTHASRAKVVS